jgi:hypothetical protein
MCHGWATSMREGLSIAILTRSLSTGRAVGRLLYVLTAVRREARRAGGLSRTFTASVSALA